MPWRWTEPPKPGARKGRDLGGFATAEEAEDNAIWNAVLKHVPDPATRKQLWKSLERSGWTREFYQS